MKRNVLLVDNPGNEVRVIVPVLFHVIHTEVTAIVPHIHLRICPVNWLHGSR